MSDGVMGALIGLAAGAILALIAWIRFHRKDKVEAAAIEQTTLGDKFDDATALTKYIAEQIEIVVKPLRDEIETLKTDRNDMYDTFRTYCSRLWVWNQKGRKTELPLLPEKMLVKLGLQHLIEYPLDDTVPGITTKETS